MSAYDDLEQALGIDMSDPDEALARDLVEADHDMLEELVRIRKFVAELTGTEVADRMGRNRSVVTNFEKLTADPHLSTIRRYAHAIGARITHTVEWVDPKGTGSTGRKEAEAAESVRVQTPDSGRQRSDLERLLSKLEERGTLIPGGSWTAVPSGVTDVNALLAVMMSGGRLVADSSHGPDDTGGRDVRVSGSSSLISYAVGTGL